MRVLTLYNRGHEILFNDFFKPSLDSINHDGKYTLVAKNEGELGVGSSLRDGEWKKLMQRKIDLILEAIDSSPEPFIYVDTDSIFANDFKEDILNRLEGLDIVAQADPGGFCAGLFACRPSENVKKFFLKVRERTLDKSDQYQFNKLRHMVSVSYLPKKKYTNPWTLRPRGEPNFVGNEVNFVTPSDHFIFHANNERGVEKKIKLLRYVKDGESTTTTYFKQYGEQRTGTNYLKRLIEKNFIDATVFASALGWKHGLYETANVETSKALGHEDWVRKKTKKDGKVYSVDGYKLPFSREELLYASSRLNYLIIIKDIYSFVYSFKNFRRPQKPWQMLVADNQVKNWCLRYIKKYTMWLELHNENKGSSMIVWYENLLNDPVEVLSRIESEFNLARKVSNLEGENKIVKASTDLGIALKQTNFDKRDFYLYGRYMEEFPQAVIEQIDKVTATQEYKDLMQSYRVFNLA